MDGFCKNTLIRVGSLGLRGERLNSIKKWGYIFVIVGSRFVL